jgi:hypothetical protein
MYPRTVTATFDPLAIEREAEERRLEREVVETALAYCERYKVMLSGEHVMLDPLDDAAAKLRAFRAAKERGT